MTWATEVVAEIVEISIGEGGESIRTPLSKRIEVAYAKIYGHG